MRSLPDLNHGYSSSEGVGYNLHNEDDKAVRGKAQRKRSSQFMNEEERYIFDVQGYLVIENAIAPQRLKEMNLWLDAKAEQDIAFQGHEETRNLSEPMLWDPLFQELLDNPKALPYLYEIMGHGVRLDHDYGIFLKPGGKGLRLHGGATPFDSSQYYMISQNRIYTGLGVVTYALTDVPEGVGGFGCVPGSHKSAFECPEEIRNFSKPSSVVRQVPVKAGDAILFTEALMHGTLPWRGEGVRRTLFFKYSPHNMSWSNSFYSPGNPDYEKIVDSREWTESQKILLQPPGVYQRTLPTGGKLRDA